MTRVSGQCLCGAARVTGEIGDTISACYCEMCTRWSGGIQMGIEAREENVTVSGPIARFRSSEMSERLWCKTCGSAIGLYNLIGEDAGLYEFVPGLFPNAGGARLTRIVYADCGAEAYQLASDAKRVSKAEYEAEAFHVE